MPKPKALIVGVANERSLAWAIAQSLHQQGYELAFTYVNDKIESRIRPLAESVGATIIEPLDVENPAQIFNLFQVLKSKWGQLDGFVHSIAFANREDLEKPFIETSKQGFQTAMNISVYSLIELSREVEKLMISGGSIITLSYLGAHRVIPNYNVMGVAKAALESSVRYLAYNLGAKKIRVNAISAGAIKTLSAAGVRDFRDMLRANETKTPLRENIDGEDVGSLGAFLISPLSKHITGTTMYVDSGAHIMN